MTWSWRTLPDARVEVDKHDGEGFKVRQSNLVPGVVQTARRVMGWLPMAEQKAAKYGVPVSWILAFIFAESGGKEKAENYCCAGLMAIYWKVHGKRREDMLDGEKNMDYGTSLLARSAAKGYELPEVASIHVAGGGSKLEPHKSAGSPWGMAEHSWPPTGPKNDGSQGYIDRVVLANNMFRDVLDGKLDLGAPIKPGKTPTPPVPTTPSKPGDDKPPELDPVPPRFQEQPSQLRQAATFGAGMFIGLGLLTVAPEILRGRR